VHCPPAPLQNPSHGSIWRIKSPPLLPPRQTGRATSIGKFFILPFFSKMLSPLSQECDYLGILWFLQMTLEMMKELFGIAHVRDDEEEDPNVKHMRVVEEEVSLLQPITVAVPPEEGEVPVLQGPSIARRKRSSQPRYRGHAGPSLSQSRQRKRRSQQPLVPILALVSSLHFFSQKRMRFFSPFYLINMVDL
jgi:hypothetical protein